MSIGSASVYCKPPCECNLGSSLLPSQVVALDSRSPRTETPHALVDVVGWLAFQLAYLNVLVVDNEWSLAVAQPVISPWLLHLEHMIKMPPCEMSWQVEVEARKHPHSWHNLDGIGLRRSGDQNTLCLLWAPLEEKNNATGLQWKWLIFHSSTPSLHPEVMAFTCPVFQFWCPLRTLHMLRQLEKELSNHDFSGYGQNLLALESPHKIILTICRAAVLFKDSCFFVICDSGGLGRSN